MVRPMARATSRMAAVTNKTENPLSIPLPRGETVHLGPRKSGPIFSHDIEHPATSPDDPRTHAP